MGQNTLLFIFSFNCDLVYTGYKKHSYKKKEKNKDEELIGKLIRESPKIKRAYQL